MACAYGTETQAHNLQTQQLFYRLWQPAGKQTAVQCLVPPALKTGVLASTNQISMGKLSHASPVQIFCEPLVFVFWRLFSHGYSPPGHPSHPSCYRDPQPRMNFLCRKLGRRPSHKDFPSCWITLALVSFSRPDCTIAGFELAPLTEAGTMGSEPATSFSRPWQMLGGDEKWFYFLFFLFWLWQLMDGGTMNECRDYWRRRVSLIWGRLSLRWTQNRYEQRLAEKMQTWDSEDRAGIMDWGILFIDNRLCCEMSLTSPTRTNWRV